MNGRVLCGRANAIRLAQGFRAMTEQETEEQIIKRVGRDIFGVLLTPQVVELVRPIYRKYLEDMEKERAA